MIRSAGGWRLARRYRSFHTPVSDTRRRGSGQQPYAFCLPGGEPVKAHLLTRFQIPIIQGMAASIIAKLLISISQFFFVVLGGALALSYLVTRPDLLWPLVLLVIVVGVFLRAYHMASGWASSRFSSVRGPLEHDPVTPGAMASTASTT